VSAREMKSMARPCIVTRRGQMGFALFGPYRLYNPGTYSVTYRITVAGPDRASCSDDWVCCYVDVTVDEGCRILARVRVLGAALKTDESIVTLEFALPQAELLEFRVWVTGVCPLIIETERSLFQPLFRGDAGNALCNVDVRYCEGEVHRPAGNTEQRLVFRVRIILALGGLSNQTVKPAWPSAQRCRLRVEVACCRPQNPMDAGDHCPSLRVKSRGLDHLDPEDALAMPPSAPRWKRAGERHADRCEHKSGLAHGHISFSAFVGSFSGPALGSY
jgi:hypothetical protein